MRPSPAGFVPARGFQETCLAPIPTFNDQSTTRNPPDENPPESIAVVTHQGHTTAPSLRTPTTAYGRRVRYTVYEFPQLLDSSSIDAKGWTSIARTIHDNYELFDGFVVLHGTDSLAYTSSALSFMLQDLGKPVVLTGSQAPMLELQNDATDNLLGSLVVAGHFVIPEVCLFFNHRLFRGNRATKTAASDFAAFDTPNFPPLAVTTSSRTEVNWAAVMRRRPAAQIGRFRVRADHLDTACVACLRVFPGIKPQMVDAVLRLPGLRGLVLETFGAGNAPQDHAMTQVLADAIQRGVVIVNVTQCLSGSVNPLYAPGRILSRAGVVAGLDLTTEAALTKLAYLLAIPESTPESIARDMSLSLRGELTESREPVFQHPEDMSDTVHALTMLGYAIAQGDLPRTRDILALSSPGLVNEVDYSGNSPMVSIPALSPFPCYLWSAPANQHSISRPPLPMSTSCVFSCCKERRCICATGPIARLSSSRPTRASPAMSTSSGSPGPICTPTSEMQAYAPRVCLSVRFLPVCLSIPGGTSSCLWASIYVFCVSSCLHAFSLSPSPIPLRFPLDPLCIRSTPRLHSTPSPRPSGQHLYPHAFSNSAAVT